MEQLVRLALAQQMGQAWLILPGLALQGHYAHRSSVKGEREGGREREREREGKWLVTTLCVCVCVWLTGTEVKVAAGRSELLSLLRNSSARSACFSSGKRFSYSVGSARD